MRLTGDILTGLLLVSRASSFPIGEEQQPIFLDEDLSKPTPHSHDLLQSTIRDVLLQHHIIGDVLDDFEPSYYLDINYPKSHESVLLGNDIPVDSVSSRPVFTFHSIDNQYSPSRRRARKSPPPAFSTKNSTFTLILTDPDAKSRDNPSKSSLGFCCLFPHGV